MAEFYYYGTLKLAIELKSVLTVVFCTRLICKIGSEKFHDFLDLTRPTSLQKRTYVANLHYRIVKLDGPSVYATSLKKI